VSAWWLAVKLLIALFLLAIAAGVAVIYTGVGTVGADDDHSPLTHRLLETVRERSVARAARSVEVRLPRLDEAALLSAVAGFDDMCAGCHAPPGHSPTALARGLNPPATDLTIAAGERTAAELFWVTRHGIRMTGMPAWGVTHSDDELWPLVALILRFPELGEGEYAGLLATAQAAGVGHGHDHGDEPAPDQHHDHDHDHDHGHRHDGHVH
jgi:hypothetical protein